MSEYSESARAAMKEKAGRLSKGDPQQKVDASSWEPPELEGSQKQTGERVLSKRAYKAGGRVAHILGEKSKHRSDRSARASGGKLLGYLRKATESKTKNALEKERSIASQERVLDRNTPSEHNSRAYKFHRENEKKAESNYNKRNVGINTALNKLEGSAKVKARKDGGKALTADSWTNRDVREANQERDGFKHVGGFKKGGTVHGHPKNCTCKKCCNGGAMKASGGSANKDPFAEDDDYVTKGKKLGGAAIDAGGRQARASGGKLLGYLRKATKDQAENSQRAGVAGGNSYLGKQWGKEASKRRAGIDNALNKLEGKAKVNARDARKSGGRTKGKTNINIIIGAGGKGNDQGNQVPNMPVRAPVPPPIVPPVAGPPPMAGGLPPGGPGAPPMMRKDGGRAARASGGKLQNYMEKARESRDANAKPYNVRGDKTWPAENQKTHQKRAIGIGMAKRKLAGEAKVPARASGGSVHVIDNAAGGGKGRLEKVKAYGLKH